MRLCKKLDLVKIIFIKKFIYDINFCKKNKLGSSGVVYKARCKITGKYVAIKEIQKGAENENLNDIINEINILKELNHPNIIKVFINTQNLVFLYFYQSK